VLLRGPGGESTDDRAVAAAFLGMLDRLAENAPVLVAVDDMQWIDASTARALAFATRRLAVPAGVLATLRTGTGGDTGWLRPPPPAHTSHLVLPPVTLGALHPDRARPDRPVSAPPGDGAHQRGLGW
jgi:hypothetical protein